MPTNPTQHFDAMFQTRSVEGFVRKRPWNREYDLIHVTMGSLRKRQMSAGYGIERSRNDPDALCAHRRFFNLNGSAEWITRPAASVAPA